MAGTAPPWATVGELAVIVDGALFTVKARVLGGVGRCAVAGHHAHRVAPHVPVGRHARKGVPCR